MDTPTFNPKQHTIKLPRGGEYLAVADRIAWLRSEAPDSTIALDLVEVTGQLAIFKATIRRIIDGEVRGSAEAFGSETPGDFKDYIEKAGTKAIGRALGLLGYGTPDMTDETQGKEGPRPVDAPRNKPAPAPEPKPAKAANPPSGRYPAPNKQSKEQTEWINEINACHAEQDSEKRSAWMRDIVNRADNDWRWTALFDRAKSPEALAWLCHQCQSAGGWNDITSGAFEAQSFDLATLPSPAESATA